VPDGESVTRFSPLGRASVPDGESSTRYSLSLLSGSMAPVSSPLKNPLPDT
jgi:hypothetical protein